MQFNKLFKEWKEEYDMNIFIEDGIVDRKQYKHILFILREMNTRENIDLREYLQSGGYYHTWNNITRWTQALIDKDILYPKDITNNQRKHYLSQIAIINLNKAGGYSKTNGKRLLKTVQTQYHYIYEEIYMCDPDMIICCGFSSHDCPSIATLLKQYILPHSDEWKTIHSSINNNWHYYNTYFNKTIPVISFVHPCLRHLNNKQGHDKLFKPLYKDMVMISKELYKK